MHGSQYVDGVNAIRIIRRGIITMSIPMVRPNTIVIIVTTCIVLILTMCLIDIMLFRLSVSAMRLVVVIIMFVVALPVVIIRNVCMKMFSWFSN